MQPHQTEERHYSVQNPLVLADAPEPAPEQTATTGASGRKPEHLVHFYESDAVLIDAVTTYIGTALRTGDTAIVIATPEHRSQLEACLAAEGVDIAVSDGQRYIAVDAAALLDRIMVDGRPDSDRFAAGIRSLVVPAVRDGQAVRVFGEMVALQAPTDPQAAIELEALWNQLQQVYPFTLLCAYPMHQVSGATGAELLEHVLAAHDRVIPAESYTALTTEPGRARAIVVWQQQARWLAAEIAHRQQVEEQLQRALAARDEFLSVAAHELRTPLTGLSAQVQLLNRRLKRDQAIDPERLAQALNIISHQTSKLTRLLGRLLDVSQMKTGKLVLEAEPTDLTALTREVVATWGALRDEAMIDLIAPPALRVSVDPLRFEQVLGNLIDNAIKHSLDGGRVEVTLTAGADGGAELTVRDHGPGIPPEKRGQVFERFFQADGNGYKHGMGLGLFVSRQIVELHGGEIGAEFPPDGGTRFFVRLPAG